MRLTYENVEVPGSELARGIGQELYPPQVGTVLYLGMSRYRVADIETYMRPAPSVKGLPENFSYSHTIVRLKSEPLQVLVPVRDEHYTSCAIWYPGDKPCDCYR